VCSAPVRDLVLTWQKLKRHSQISCAQATQHQCAVALVQSSSILDLLVAESTGHPLIHHGRPLGPSLLSAAHRHSARVRTEGSIGPGNAIDRPAVHVGGAGK
jgi:hypothetical protein